MKKFIAAAMAVFILTLCAGCSVHKIIEPISEDKFTEVSENLGLTVECKKGEASTSYNADGGDYGAQFYLFGTVSQCDSSFNYIINLLTASDDEEGNDVTVDRSESPYKKCVIRTAKDYNVLIQIDNTLFFGFSYEEESDDELDKYIEALGY